MNRRMTWLIILVILLIVIPINLPGVDKALGADWHLREGLDLQGGQQILLEADLPADQSVTASQMDVAKSIIENRINALGLTEPVIQVSLPRRIVVELPGYDDPEAALSLIKNTALLEFVEAPYDLPVGTVVNTDYLSSNQANVNSNGTQTPDTGETPAIIPSATPTLSGITLIGTVTPSGTPAASDSATPTLTLHTIMTGADLKSAAVSSDTAGLPDVTFVLTTDGGKLFADYTTAHVGDYLAITLDKTVISCPVIEGPITGGSGVITGKFTVTEVNQLAIQLSYGALPIPLKVIRNQSIGPTLGQDSLRRSLIAGLIGLLAVVLFMFLYYRLPGILADIALAMYGLTALAIYRVLPVTFTLPGIAGFILSVGMAVDANILIFERMKEELRGGRILRDAVDVGFSRAWTSIRDSNISTLITCGILYWFGSTFGASIVKGFAVTLAVGVLVSMFTAIVVTRSLLHLILDRVDFSSRHSWFGISGDKQPNAESAE